MNNLYKILLVIVIIIYFSYTYGRENYKNRNKNKSFRNKVVEYNNVEKYENSKLKDFIPKKTSNLLAICNHEDKCMKY